MRLPEPIRMERIAVVAPVEGLRPVLLAVGSAGVIEPELLPDSPPAPEFAAEPELAGVAASTVRHGTVAAFAGWSPASAVAPLAERLRPLGGAIVRLPFPPGTDPPTLLATGGTSAAFQPLVDIYDTVPYADVNPSLFAGLAYVTMFGMMFGDAGHGAMLLALGIVLARARSGPLAAYRRAALFVIGAGVASIVFGFAYGEAFGPTGLVPTLWLSPLAQPVTLLVAAVGAGAGLLAISYGFGTANRWREGGPALALVALSGFAGSALYLGLALAGAGWLLHLLPLTVAGGVLALAGLGLGYTGLYLQGGGRGAGAVEAGIELFDAVVRIGSNTVSFGRLAAFGLTHAALGAIFWNGTVFFAARGPLWWPLAVLVFLGGNALAFTLEALVAGVQALRLDYYELFSRIFVGTGRTFRPWHLSPQTAKEAPV
jgi:V/A-type H+-transporting ATPase subunit I